MKKKLFAVTSAVIFSATAAFANPQVESIVEQLKDQGYGRIEVQLGTDYIRVDAVRGRTERSFLVDRETGKVMNDRSRTIWKKSKEERVTIEEVEGNPTGAEGGEVNETPAVSAPPKKERKPIRELPKKPLPPVAAPEKPAVGPEDIFDRLQEELERLKEEVIQEAPEKPAYQGKVERPSLPPVKRPAPIKPEARVIEKPIAWVEAPVVEEPQMTEEERAREEWELEREAQEMAEAERAREEWELEREAEEMAEAERAREEWELEREAEELAQEEMPVKKPIGLIENGY